MDGLQKMSTGDQVQAGVEDEPGSLPSGTVTFLFTDIEGSTRLLEELREGYAQLLAEQRLLLRTAFQNWRGHEIDTQGDSFFVAFGRATDAIACVIEAQRCLQKHTWPQGVSVKVRMGMHTGEPVIARTGYVGIDVHRAARVASAGHGGQVLLSQATRDLVYQDLPPGASLRFLGEHKLKDIRFAQPLFQVDIAGLPCEFPPLKTLPLAEEPPTPGKPPFKGLQYFDEADADLFFGRSQVTAHLLEAVNQQAFLAVVGASGSGKSSVVRAGLVPALKRSQPGSWKAFILTPTAQPLESLAVELTRGLESITACKTLMDDLRREPRCLHLYARKQLSGRGMKWLLVIDQFEELFTLCRDTAERQAFVDNLLYAALARNGRVHVVIALRADFYDHLAEYAGLRQAVAKHQEYLGAMNAEELRQAIEEPAKLGGWEFTPGLVELMLHEIGAEAGRQPEPGALPLLSHALLETWNHRRGNLMNLKAYSESGGVHKAIAHTAENLYSQGLTPSQQQIARNIFLRLTELGEGTQDTRRRVSIQELYPSAAYGDPKEVEEVLVKLADARLITTGEGTAEVAHEALIREWPTLREWLAHNREGLLVQRRLTESAQEWQLLERDPGVLYRGARLAQALEWSSAHPQQLNALEQAFLAASQEAVEREQAEREAQRQRELDAAHKLAETEKGRAEAERQRAEEQTRSARRLQRRAWQLAGVLALALILAAAAGIFGRQAQANSRLANQNMVSAQSAEQHALGQQATAESERQRAEDERTRAEGEASQRATAEAVAVQERETAEQQARLAFSRELAAASVNNLQIDSQRSLLLALQAVQTYDTPQAQNALHQAIKGSRLRYSMNLSQKPLFGVAFSPDGTRVAVNSMDGNIYILDVDSSGKRLEPAISHKIPNRTFDDVDNTTVTLAFSPDGKWLAGISSESTGKIWESDSGRLLQTLSGHTADVYSITFSPDGRLVATGSKDATVKIWEAATGKELQTLDGFTDFIQAIAFSPDGKFLAAGSLESKAIVWEVQYPPNGSPEFTQSFTVESGPKDWYVNSLAFSADGKKLATGSSTNLRVYDIQSASPASAPVPLLNVYAHKDSLNGLFFDQSSQRLFTGSWDGLAKVWDATSGEELFSLAGNAGGVLQIAINPQETILLTVHDDGSLKGWDITDGGNQEWFTIHGEAQSGVISEDGTQFFIRKERDETVLKIQIWGLSPTGLSKTPAREINFPAEGNVGAGVGPSFSVLRINRDDLSARVRNFETWDINTVQKIASFPIFKSRTESGPLCTRFVDCIFYLYTSADEKLLAVSLETGRVSVWEIATGKLIREFNFPERNPFVAISPDGNQLVIVSHVDPIARMWDIRSGALLMEFKGHSAAVYNARFSPDGKSLLTGSMDNTAKLWDVQTGQEILTLVGHTSYVVDVGFSPDGKYLATGGGDGTVRVWEASTGQELYSFPGNTLQFSPDSKGLLTKHYDGIARGFYLDINDLVALARSRLIRTWTLEECQKFLHTDTCPPTP